METVSGLFNFTNLEQAMEEYARNVLVSVIGSTPAVLTETVYALATHPDGLLPDRIIVITTETGRRLLVQELFQNGYWEGLKEVLVNSGVMIKNKLVFGAADDAIRVIPSLDRSRNLEDIRSLEENQAAGDFILSVLKAEAEDPETRLISSIAGGRKTMGAFMVCGMMLTGRRHDRIFHVLVSEPFDNSRLFPKFMFPTIPPSVHQLDDEQWSSDQAEIHLAEIPFVPLQYWYGKDPKELPTRYLDMINEIWGEEDTAQALQCKVRLEASRGLLFVNDNSIALSPGAFALMWILADSKKAGINSFEDRVQLIDAMEAFQCQLNKKDWIYAGWANDWKNSSIGLEELRRYISEIHTKVKKTFPRSRGIVNRLNLSSKDHSRHVSLPIEASCIELVLPQPGKLNG